MKLTRYLLAVALAALTTGAHAQAISALTGASALSGSEVTAVVQSATTKKATVDQFRTYILGGNTWTAGTGTLTLGAGKTATISNTLTFAGTDGSTLNVGTGGTLGTAAYTASSAYETAGVALLKASNLSDLTSASTARTNLGLGTLATQSGTFSGTSSGTNTGDQTTITGNAGTATALQTARAIYGNNFDGTAALTSIIASTYGGTGNGFTKFTGPTTAERTFTLPDSSATLLYSGGAAGTPSSITLTNGTALPSAGITMSTARLLGRTTASSGAAEEITVGAGLSLSAGTLTATGGSVAIGDVTGLGTNVATALGVAVGSDGAFVTRGGNAGTPSALVCTNCTGTASGLTAGTVTTNANLTGDVTSSGNATTLATVNSNVGSFTNSSITVNGKGLITAASSGAAGAVLTANIFTRLQTITQGTANEGILASTGYSLTGSNATSMIDLAGTLNTTGNPVALKIALTNTASGATTKFASFLAGASGTTEVFNVSKAGVITATGDQAALNFTGSYFDIAIAGSPKYRFSSGIRPQAVSFNLGAASPNEMWQDIVLYRNLVFVDGVASGNADTYLARSAAGSVTVSDGANGKSLGIKMLTELTTIAAAATTTTTIQKPANSIILGVSVRNTVALPITSTYTVGDSGSAARFSTAAVSKAVNSTDPGTKAGAYYNATAEGIIITPDTTPSDATGRVRVTIHYIDVTPPTS